MVTDLWSTGYSMPKTDTTQNYEPTTGTLADGVYTFAVTRALDTGDADQDQVLVCGQDYDMAWTGHKSSGNLGKHNIKGEFSISLADDCTVSMADSSFAMTFSALIAILAALIVSA